MVSFQTKQFDENPKSLTQVNLDMSKSADDRMDCRPRPRVMSLMSLCLPLVRTDRLEMAHCITGQTSEKCRSNSEKVCYLPHRQVILHAKCDNIQ